MADPRMEACQEAYNAALSKLEGQDRLKNEFDKMWKALIKSNDSNQKLQQKAAELEAEVLAQSDKVQRAKSEEELQQMEKKDLQDEIEKNQREIGMQKLLHREKSTMLEELQRAIAELEEQVEIGPGWTPEQEKRLAQLQKRQVDLEHLLEQKISKLQTSRQDVQIISETVAKAEAERVTLEDEIADLRAQVEDNERSCKEAQLRRDRVDTDLRTLKARVENLQFELSGKETKVASGNAEIDALDNKLKAAKTKMEHYLNEYDNLFQQTQRLTGALDDQTRINKFLTEELGKREADIEVKRKESKAVKKEMDGVKRMMAHAEKRIAETDGLREKAEAHRVQIRERTQTVEREIRVARKENDTLQRQVDDLVKEREVLNKTLMKAEDRTKQVHDLISMYNNTKRNLENEIQGYKTDAITDRQGIEALEEEVQKYEKEAALESQRFANALEEVRLQDARISELQKRIAEGEGKLKQQQNLYEAVRSDRNLYSKNLIEAQEEIAEMKRKFKIMNHQIEQLKEEITTKDHSLVKEHFSHQKVEKEKEQLKNELTKIRKQTQSSEQIINNQEFEIQKLTQIMREAEEERARQEKEYRAIISERDILGSQLIRRNEELASLYEKIKLQMSALRKGESQFNALSGDLRSLQRTVRVLHRERKKLNEQVSGIPELDTEIIRLEREIAQERSKVKALSDEMERPLNVHRWRKLESSDPERFALIKKIQSTQVKLIEKTEEVALKAKQIEEKEKLYVELKNVLARQPGPEVAEQLVVYQQNLKDKQRQIKEMEADLETHRAKVNEYKFEIEALNNQMRGLKKDYIRRNLRHLLHLFRFIVFILWVFFFVGVVVFICCSVSFLP
ncbi:Cilia- and flagella-associated protein 58 [Hondaea fermentalgiana]|uniref:Cilia-and flagella-associated protein 58 n=1 Tax=Hondaea fermentalgiana TaxID=2315210 RepID=A0A2R5GD58_9STRA|nr:Cilia- and flagella-associated protein 58 [Hondaea fermentalgiana]|eukprot:GBG28495.1 Cilia- and flagella-associated protein 58 [Hondaea fermentalgiana]